MTNLFSAKPQALGYLHQVRFSLLLILEREESTISIESLDDLVFEESGNSLELLQLKHHMTQATLTDSSHDLWKTLRVWCTHAINGNVTFPGTILSLITTGLAPDDSAASYLRTGPSRDPQQAYQRLVEVVGKLTNVHLFPSVKAFNDLPEATRESIVHAIYVLDNFVLTYQNEPIVTPGGLKNSFITACGKAGIPYGRHESNGITFHDLRRTVKTNMLSAGVDKVYRDTILGHSLHEMDVHYMSPTEEDLHGAMAKFTAWIDAQIQSVAHSVAQVNE